MSEKPMSLIDDKKSNQVTYSADQIINNHEAQRAFFEQAERQIAPEPPKFDLYEEPKAFDSDMMTEIDTATYVAEVPAYAKEPVSHREILERAYRSMDTLELVADARMCTKAIVVTRHLY